MLSDQDDYWLPEKIEHTYNHLKKNNADLVFTDLTVVDEKQNIVSDSFNDMMNLTRKISRTLNTQEMVDLYKRILHLSMDNSLTHSINICTYASISKALLPALSKSLKYV